MKFVYKTSAGATIRTQDNVLSVPGAAVNLDIQGTVGVAVAAGEVCYLSSGAESPALTPGLWYLADADFAVSSTTCQSIGMAVSAIAINTAGTIRIAGLATTASAVVVGSTYYVSATAGGITTSAPALSRVVGVADTTSTLILAATSAVAATLPNPIAQDCCLLTPRWQVWGESFPGKSGASRPRDLFQSRNATIGGTLGRHGCGDVSESDADGRPKHRADRHSADRANHRGRWPHPARRWGLCTDRQGVCGDRGRDRAVGLRDAGDPMKSGVSANQLWTQVPVASRTVSLGAGAAGTIKSIQRGTQARADEIYAEMIAVSQPFPA
jgi:hypothetical protein